MIKRDKIKISEIEANQTNIFAENRVVELPKEIKKFDEFKYNLSEKILEGISLMELFDEYEREYYSERSAIMEYDGNLVKESAENVARSTILNQRIIESSGIEKSLFAEMGAIELKGVDNNKFNFGGSVGYYH